MLIKGSIMKINLLVLFCTCTHFDTATASNATERHRLYRDLFVLQEYDSNIQPVLSHHNFTDVYMRMYLKTINSLDGVSETLQTSAYLRISWTDVFLTWNSTDYNGMWFTYIPQDEVWRPDIILYNSIQIYRPLGHKTIMVESVDDGTIIWYPMELFETSCSVDMTYFPFDIQICEIQFMPWSYATVRLEADGDGINLIYYSRNALWEILDTSVEITDVFNVDVIAFKIKMQRKPQHNILTLFLPALLLAILNVFTTVLPIGGDRSGYAVTVFLAFSVFLTIVDSVMPPNSEKVSLFSIYLVIQTSQSTIITILSVLLTRAESLDESTKIPRFLVILERKSQGLCKQKTAKINPKAKETKITEIDDHVDDDGKLSVVEGTDDAPRCTWMRLVKAIDKIAFIVFLLVFVLSTTFFIFTITLGPN